jgi:hypothetical protein
MFIQVILGKVNDKDAAIAAGESWQTEIRPGAIGFLGGTSGVADDGTYVVVARFESADSAKANGERPEQSAWFEKNKSMFAGEPTFYDCPEVQLMRGGGSDDAGFVQLMIYTPKDVAAVKAMNKEFESMEGRPDILGSTTGYATDGTVIDTIYFSSEAEARAGEKEEPPAEMAAAMEGFMENIGEVRYVDLKEPSFS